MTWFISTLRRPAPLWFVSLIAAMSLAVIAHAAYPIYYAQLFAVTNSSSVQPLVVTGAASQSADMTDWKNSGGSVLASISSAGNGAFQSIGGTTITASTEVSSPLYYSSAFSASVPTCTNGSGDLSAAGSCTILTVPYDNSGAPIIVKSAGTCAANTVCKCQTAPGTGESNCDSDQYYNLYPYQLCEAREEYAGPGVPTFGLIAFVATNTALGAGNNGDHLLFFNGSGATLAAGTDMASNVLCKAIR